MGDHQFPDVQDLGVDHLEDLLADHEPDVTVAVGVPEDWGHDSDTHIEVAFDGTPTIRAAFGGVLMSADGTLRIVVRAQTTAEAKRIALLCQGLLIGSTGHGITAIRPGVGVQPARDPQTNAELAGFTVLATVRAQLIPAGS